MKPPKIRYNESSYLTEVFSLGVTVFETLTGEHPYLGGKDGKVFNSQIRSSALRALLKKSSELSRLIEIALKAISLDPAERPPSYQSMLEFMKAKGSTFSQKSNRFDTISQVVALARFYRVQKRFPEAERILSEALLEHPDNPVLLNAISLVFGERHMLQEATCHLEKAVDFLRLSSGFYNGQVYCDPSINLGSYAILSGKFDDAIEYLSEARSWIGNLTDRQQETELYYNELGWLHLYEGNFQKACNHLLKASNYRACDGLWVKWFTLASWLNGNPEDHAFDLYRTLSSYRRFDFTLGLCLVLNGFLVEERLRARILRRITPDLDFYLSGLEETRSLPPGSLRPPTTVQACRIGLIELDTEITGGKFHGFL